MDGTDAPESPPSSVSHAWPSVLAGCASPFSMPKVCQSSAPMMTDCSTLYRAMTVSLSPKAMAFRQLS